MVIVDYLQLMLSPSEGPQEHERPDIGHHTATEADRQGERHPRRAAEPAEPELRGETHAEEHAVRPAVTWLHRARRRYGILPPPPLCDEHRRGPGDPSLHRGPGYPLDRQEPARGVRRGAFLPQQGVTRFTDDRTPVPNDRRPAKAELDKDLFG